MNNDLISRSVLKEQFKNEWNYDVDYSIFKRIEQIVDDTPTVEAKIVADCVIAYGDGFESARRLFEKPHGEWVEFKYGLYYCSNCFDKVDKDIDRIEHLVAKRDLSPFCPFCGSLMKEKGE